MSDLRSDSEDVDSILEEILTLTSVPHSTQSIDLLPELEHLPDSYVDDFEIDIPLPNDPNEIPLPADIPNQPPSPTIEQMQQASSKSMFKAPPPRLTRILLDPSEISLQRVHQLNGKLIAEIDTKIELIRRRCTAIQTRVLCVTSKLTNIEWEREAASLGGSVVPKQTTLTPFHKPYFRSGQFDTPYDGSTPLNIVDQTLAPFGPDPTRLTTRQDALIKSFVRQENKFKVADKVNECLSGHAESLRKVRQKYSRGEMGLDDFVDYAETESVVSKARVSEELESLCSSIGGEQIDPDQVDWPVVTAKVLKNSVKFAHVSGSAYQKRVKESKPLLSAFGVRQRWLNKIDRRLNNGPFSYDEQTQIIAHFDMDKMTWAQIASKFSSDERGLRRPIQCFKQYRASKLSQASDRLPLVALERFKLSRLGTRKTKQSREHRTWSACFHRRTVSTLANRRVQMRENGKRVSYHVHEHVSSLTPNEELALLDHLLAKRTVDSVSACSSVLPGREPIETRYRSICFEMILKGHLSHWRVLNAAWERSCQRGYWCAPFVSGVSIKDGLARGDFHVFETTVDNEQRDRIKSLIGRFRNCPTVGLVDKIKTAASLNPLRDSIGALMTPSPSSLTGATQATSLSAGIELTRALLSDLRAQAVKVKPGDDDTSAELSRNVVSLL